MGADSWDEKRRKSSRHAYVCTPSEEEELHKTRSHRPHAASPAAAATDKTGLDSANSPAPRSHQPLPVPVNTGINPAFGQNQVLLHTTQPQPPTYHQIGHPGAQYLVTAAPAHPGVIAQPAALPILNTTPLYTNPTPIIPTNPSTGDKMSGDYQNAGPINQGVSFQPQVPSTQNGPELHYYVPRHDGVQYYQPAFQPVPGVAGIPMQQPGYIASVSAPMQGMMAQQPAMYPPMMAAQPPMQLPMAVPQLVNPAPVMMSGAIPAHMAPGNCLPAPASIHPDPVTGIGQTGQELRAAQAHFAYANNMFEPQDIKPADDDPSRYFFVRELDGEWTQRNRFTIDNLGDCRWYITDGGMLYAARLPN